jgi:hypothetical protein
MVGLNLLRRFWQKQAPEAPGAPAAPFDSHSLLFGSPKSGEKPIAPTSTVAVIGNCIAEGIVDGLSSAKAATSKFRFVAIPLHLRSLESVSNRFFNVQSCAAAAC